jgi:hypothetical protein
MQVSDQIHAPADLPPVRVGYSYIIVEQIRVSIL